MEDQNSNEASRKRTTLGIVCLFFALAIIVVVSVILVVPWESRISPGVIRDQLGVWEGTIPTHPVWCYQFTIYVNYYDKTFLRARTHDGKVYDYPLVEEIVQGEKRLINPEASRGEYFVINPDGTLSVYDKDGLKVTLQKP